MLQIFVSIGQKEKKRLGWLFVLSVKPKDWGRFPIWEKATQSAANDNDNNNIVLVVSCC